MEIVPRERFPNLSATELSDLLPNVETYDLNTADAEHLREAIGIKIAALEAELAFTQGQLDGSRKMCDGWKDAHEKAEAEMVACRTELAEANAALSADDSPRLQHWKRKAEMLKARAEAAARKRR
jgi:hypothetical protein